MQQLVRLTDDLLDVSRITRNRIELRRERIDLRTVMRSAVETIEPLSDAAGHVVAVDLPADAAVGLRRLHPAGAGVRQPAEQRGEVHRPRRPHLGLGVVGRATRRVVTVSDTGIGIEPALLPRIFDMFVQIEQGASRARSGLGIGLTLAKRLIELHDGRIDARSAGRGHRARRSSSGCRRRGRRRTEADRQPKPAATPTRCRVLVAEDIPDAAEMMRLMIECMGHDVRVAADGVQAVAIAQEFDPQIALLDIGMPRMDGYEAARRIRAALGDARRPRRAHRMGAGGGPAARACGRLRSPRHQARRTRRPRIADRVRGSRPLTRSGLPSLSRGQSGIELLFERNVNEVKTRGNHADHCCFSRPTVHATEVRRVGATNHRRQAAGVAGRLAGARVGGPRGRTGTKRVPRGRRVGIRGCVPPVWREADPDSEVGRDRGRARDLSGAHVRVRVSGSVHIDRFTEHEERTITVSRGLL